MKKIELDIAHTINIQNEKRLKHIYGIYQYFYIIRFCNFF